MKYRGLTYNREKESYEWVYGLPSYGYATDEVAEIGTVYGLSLIHISKIEKKLKK